MPFTISRTKTADETISVDFDFGFILPVGESITGATITPSVFSGVDASPSSMVASPATISGTTVTQDITVGELGVIYDMVATITTSDTHVYTRTSRLAVVTPGGLFGQNN